MFHDLRHNKRRLDQSRSRLVHLETHPVVDLIVGKCYVILEGVVPGHADLRKHDLEQTPTLRPRHTIS